MKRRTHTKRLRLLIRECKKMRVTKMMNSFFVVYVLNVHLTTFYIQLVSCFVSKTFFF
jgi:hypothetical protein